MATSGLRPPPARRTRSESSRLPPPIPSGRGRSCWQRCRSPPRPPRCRHSQRRELRSPPTDGARAHSGAGTKRRSVRESGWRRSSTNVIVRRPRQKSRHYSPDAASRRPRTGPKVVFLAQCPPRRWSWGPWTFQCRPAWCSSWHRRDLQKELFLLSPAAAELGPVDFPVLSCMVLFMASLPSDKCCATAPANGIANKPAASNIQREIEVITASFPAWPLYAAMFDQTLRASQSFCIPQCSTRRIDCSKHVNPQVLTAPPPPSSSTTAWGLPPISSSALCALRHRERHPSRLRDEEAGLPYRAVEPGGG